MNYQNRALIEELAAQYVIGTLRGPARRRFEKLYQRDAGVLMAVQRWEDRLMDLASAVTPVRPPSRAWRGVQQRIRRDASQGRSHAPSQRTRWALAAASAMLILAMTLWMLVLSPTTQVIATFADQQQSELWRIEATRGRAELRVEALAALQPNTNRAYELWALSPTDGAPVSLGLMPQSGTLALELNESQRSALASARQLAISLEPRGGSPTGAPTGPVLYVTALVMG